MEVHRDRAVELFIEHCHAEGKNLHRSVAELFEIPTGDEQGIAAEALLSSHCFAIATAVGLDSVAHNVVPSHQMTAVLWAANKTIIEQDVGKANVGRAPSPWPSPDVHVSYAPGTFVGGIPSPQQKLTKLYRSLKTIPARLVLLLFSVNGFRPKMGLYKINYSREELAHGIDGCNEIGRHLVGDDGFRIWDDDFRLVDPNAALSELPPQFVRSLSLAIARVDPFWPNYCRTHRLTW